MVSDFDKAAAARDLRLSGSHFVYLLKAAAVRDLRLSGFTFCLLIEGRCAQSLDQPPSTAHSHLQVDEYELQLAMLGKRSPLHPRLPRTNLECIICRQGLGGFFMATF